MVVMLFFLCFGSKHVARIGDAQLCQHASTRISHLPSDRHLLLQRPRPALILLLVGTEEVVQVLLDDLSFFFRVFRVFQSTHLFWIFLELLTQLHEGRIFVEFDVSLLVPDDLDLVFGQLLGVLDQHLELGAEVVDLAVLSGLVVHGSLRLIRAEEVPVHEREVDLVLVADLAVLGVLDDLVRAESKVEILDPVNHFVAVLSAGQLVFCAYVYNSLPHGLPKIIEISRKIRILPEPLDIETILLQSGASRLLNEVVCKNLEVQRKTFGMSIEKLFHVEFHTIVNWIASRELKFITIFHHIDWSVYGVISVDAFGSCNIRDVWQLRHVYFFMLTIGVHDHIFFQVVL